MNARKIWLICGVAVFVVYFFGAARPIPPETVLVPRWLTSLESGMPVPLGSAETNSVDVALGGASLPFNFGGRFGYVRRDGSFLLNREQTANVSVSAEKWAEYVAAPETVTINGPDGETLAVLENPRGYPFFLDGRTFILGSDHNAVSEIDSSGKLSWTYECASPITCIDSAAGFVLAGTLDGAVLLLDGEGKRVFAFEPGGSRLAVMAGCALSPDGRRLALVSGIDDQRFLLLERFGVGSGDYKVVYHEFLEDGFRRPVYVDFIDDGRRVVFERTGGIGFYETGAAHSKKVWLDGEIRAVEHSTGQKFVFAVVARQGTAKELAMIRLPAKVTGKAPFYSEDVFLDSMDSTLFAGGGHTMVSFDIVKK